MAKRWSTFEHPSDLGLEARADSLGELFEALGEGVAEHTCPRGSVRPDQTRRVEAHADGPENLLVDFLGELLKLFHLERFLIARVRVAAIDDRHVRAEADGETYDPARHELGAEIKAVTYHQLRVACQAGQWTGRVLLDL